MVFNITFGAQTWAATSNFANGGAAGNQIFRKNLELNDPNSWDLRVRIWDDDYPAANNVTFGEFGVNKFTNISASGNPVANAPPGSSVVPFFGESLVTFSANDDYYVNVSVKDLSDGTNTITADNLGITLMGGSQSYILGTNYTSQVNVAQYGWGMNFTAADSDLNVWGNSSAGGGGFMPAPYNGTATHWNWSSNFELGYYDVTRISWFVSIPAATPEGIYTGTITFTIETG